ncbi:MAG: hypothetical protein AAB594_02575 [Patescibacteria group bacterium]
MQRFKKQVIYGGTFLLLIIFFLAWIYFSYLKPEASCFDKKKNQNEEGIDCGGVCGNFCFPVDFRPIELVRDPSFLRVDGKHVSLIAEIQNPNGHLATKNFSFEFRVFGESKTPLKIITGESFLYSGEIKTIIAPNIEVDLSKIERVEFIPATSLWTQDGNFPRPNFKLQNKKTSFLDRNIVTEGNIVSEESQVFAEVEVIAVFKNPARVKVGVSRTVITNFKPDETRNFSIIHPLIDNVDLGATEILIYSKR